MAGGLIKEFRDFNKWQRISLLLITVFVFSSFSQYIWDSFKLGNNLYPLHGFKNTESNVYRAAMNYNRNGFLSNAGLPLITGPEWKLHGRTRPYILAKEKVPSTVYTHNPPGPYLLLGLLVKIFGPDRLQVYRLAPISLGIAAVFLSAFLLLSCGLNPLGVVIYTLAVLRIPAFTHFLPVLHYPSYGISFFLLSFALYLRYLFRQNADSTRNRRYHQIFFFLGFLQGYFSFEWFFVAIFFTIPLWFFIKHFDTALDLHTLIKPTFYLFAGFLIAHLLHLLQVAVYYGGLWKAISYLTTVAYRRSAGDPISRSPQYLNNLYASTAMLFIRLRSNPHLFTFDIITFSGLILLLIKTAKRVWGPTVIFTIKTLKIELFDLVINRNTLWMFGSAFIISISWFLLMRHHAVMNMFTVTHFLLFYLILVMCLVFILAPRKEFLIFLFIITLPTTVSSLSFPYYRTLKYYYENFPSKIIEFSIQQHENRYRPLYGSAVLLEDYKIWRIAEETYIIKMYFKTHHTINEDYSLDIEVIDPANRNSGQSAFYSEKDYPVKGLPTSKWKVGASNRYARAFYAKSDKVDLRISWTITDKNGKKKYNPIWYNNKPWDGLILNARLPEKIEYVE